MQAHVERPVLGGVVIRHVNPEAEGAGAAGTMTATAVAVEAAPPAPPVVKQAYAVPADAATYVGEYGAMVVAGALNRVARINNIPVAAGEWLHGSIAGRMRYLQELSGEAGRTAKFDSYMRRVYWGLVGVAVVLGVWVGVQAGM
jgi:hypothetical protein